MRGNIPEIGGDEVLRESGQLTLQALQATAVKALSQAGIEDARTDARLLIQHALGLDRSRMLAERDRTVTAAERERVERLVARRLAREPVSRILGMREFWSLEFVLSPATLDPRPDTETVVEAALALVPDRRGPLRLLDLGTGTGCLLLALLSELPNAVGIGVDRDAEAAATARCNAVRLGLSGRAAFAIGDWGTALGGGFDLVVSNPPYIAEHEMSGLAPEVVRFDPTAALVAGPDGLAAYRAIAADLHRLMAPGGRVVLEVGRGQASAVTDLLARSGVVDLGVRLDLAGIPRVVCGGKKDWKCPDGTLGLG
ncbi:MAG TPA: peptide chain release factor N(5)-glutamine methyltransferase [Alphaproteobacteria bacterium]|nr:peptide chain release factor N(5)-glutamine methyltransferase [Alphaproteobacteria bacterium]